MSRCVCIKWKPLSCAWSFSRSCFSCIYSSLFCSSTFAFSSLSSSCLSWIRVRSVCMSSYRPYNVRTINTQSLQRNRQRQKIKTNCKSPFLSLVLLPCIFIFYFPPDYNIYFHIPQRIVLTGSHCWVARNALISRSLYRSMRTNELFNIIREEIAVEP